MISYNSERWRIHRQTSKQRHTARFLLYTLERSSTNLEDFRDIEKEMTNIFYAITEAKIRQDWSVIIQLVYPLLEGSLRTRGYWDESVQCGYLLLEAAKQCGDKTAAGWAWTSAIGWVEIQRGRYTDGRESILKGLQAFREAGNEWGTWQARRHLGQTYREIGDIETAKSIYLAALNDAKKAYSKRWPTPSLLKPYLKFIKRNWHRRKWSWTDFVVTRQRDYMSIIAHYYLELGGLAGKERRLPEARRYFEDALLVFTKTGQATDICAALVGLAHVARAEESWNESRQLFLRSLELNQDYQVRISLADAYLGLSQVESAQGQMEKGQQYFLLAYNIYQSLGIDIEKAKDSLFF